MTKTQIFNAELDAELSRVAHMLADVARPIALRYFRGAGQNVENKLVGDFDPVTVADREIEVAMRDVLAKERPDDGIVGEEFGTLAGRSGLVWVLDPIDGTRSFIAGTPTWGVLIAVGDDTGPRIGIVDQPFTGERFFGAPGRAVWQRGDEQRDMIVRSCESLQSAILFSTFPEVGSTDERLAFERVRDQVKLTRYGTDCYAYGLLAAGQVDLVIEAGLNPYDVQGPIAVIQAAGGIVTNWSGAPAHSGGQIIAAGDAKVHAAALKVLNG